MVEILCHYLNNYHLSVNGAICEFPFRFTVKVLVETASARIIHTHPFSQILGPKDDCCPQSQKLSSFVHLPQGEWYSWLLTCDVAQQYGQKHGQARIRAPWKLMPNRNPLVLSGPKP